MRMFEQKQKLVVVGLRISEFERRQVRKLAAMNGLTTSEICRQIIQQYLKKESEKTP